MSFLLKALVACSLVPCGLVGMAATTVGAETPPAVTSMLPQWMAKLQPDLLQSAGEVAPLSPNKITAVVHDGSRKFFVPGLLDLRDANPGDLQLIVVSMHTPAGLTKYLADPKPRVQVVLHDSPAGIRLMRLTGSGSWPHVTIVDPAGTVINRTAFHLFADPTAPVTISTGDPEAVARWHRLIGVGQGRKALTVEQHAAELERLFGTTPGWVPFAKILAGESDEEIRKAFTDLGREIGLTGRWDHLLELMELSRHAFARARGEFFERLWYTGDCAEEAGRSAKDRPAMFAALRPWLTTVEDDRSLRTVALHAVAQQLARENDPEMAKIFWEAIDWNETTVLEALLVAGDVRAYAHLRRVAASRGRQSGVTSALKPALAAKRPEALALWAELLKEYPDQYSQKDIAR